VSKQEPLYTAGGNAKLYNHDGKQYGDSLKKLEIELPYDSVIPLLVATQGNIKQDTIETPVH
jgi:hypothetical protein